jgi:hypothetical protein
VGITIVMGLAACQALGEVGIVAAAQGAVDLQRRGAWSDVDPGYTLQIGDRVRSGANGRAKLVMQDDSVLDVAPNTELVIDDSSAHDGHPHSSYRLFRGRVLGRASEVYADESARFEIETPNALVSVQGTEFVVGHDADVEATEVYGLSGTVDVVGKIGAMGGGKVSVGQGMMTRVPKGRLPSAPVQLSDDQRRRSLAGIEIAGTGRRDGLNVLHPVIAGRLIGPQDLPGAEAPEPARQWRLGGDAPGFAGAAAQSLDVYTNSQPLQVFRALPPGRVPAGGIRVRF